MSKLHDFKNAELSTTEQENTQGEWGVVYSSYGYKRFYSGSESSSSSKGKGGSGLTKGGSGKGKGGSGKGKSGSGKGGLVVKRVSVAPKVVYRPVSYSHC